MPARSPHFLLFSDASGGDTRRSDRWSFVLQSVGGQQYLAAQDSEPGARSSRLELLALVRGLEALDQPSRVTLITRSRYVSRGIRRGLSQWRARRWRWEHFGELVPIRDHDLWQRVDRAMKFHEVDCCPRLAEALDETLENITGDQTQCEASVATEPCERHQILPVPKLEETDADAKRTIGETQPTELAACSEINPQAVILAGKSAPRRAQSSRQIDAVKAWSLAGAVARLRQKVLTPFTHLRGPAFTRAA